MIFLLWVKGILKSLGWKGIVALAVIGLIVFLWTGNQSLKARVETLKRDLITAAAKIDTIFVDAQYSSPDTVWRTIIRTFTDTLTGEVDTLYEDIPVISGDIKFDETQVFGEDNFLSVQVRGAFYYPEEFAWQNWMQVIPDWRKPPDLAPISLKAKSWGINTDIFMSSKGWAGAGLTFKYKRFSVGAGKYFGNKPWTFTIGYSIFGKGGS